MSTTNDNNYILNDLGATPWFAVERSVMEAIISKLPAADQNVVTNQHWHTTVNNTLGVTVISVSGNTVSLPFLADGVLQVTGGAVSSTNTNPFGGVSLVDTTSFQGPIQGLVTPKLVWNEINQALYAGATGSSYLVQVGSGSLQGPTGIGAQGPVGATGIQGIPGPSGNTGSQGVAGNTGVMGITGVQGITGVRGITGIVGITGTTLGATGVQGQTGPGGPTNRPAETTVTSSSTPTPNSNITDIYTVTALAVGATFGAPTGSPTDGQNMLIRIKDSGSPQSLAWNAVYVPIGVVLPTTTVSGKYLYVGIVYNSQASTWDVLATGQQ
jgi:Collagen triple helix repeat (20 copies)